MANLLLYLGKSLKLIAGRLGHSSETLVLTAYGHLQPADDREAAEALWDVIQRLQRDGRRDGRLNEPQRVEQ